MGKSISKLEARRRRGENQVDEQHSNILDAAEKIFLSKGFENTTMSDIAAGAGISRVSLYRYFPDLHPIAFEIAVRMLKRSLESTRVEEGNSAFGHFRMYINSAIDQFFHLRDVYRYLGMFDHLYGVSYPSEQLATWYREELSCLMTGWEMKDAPNGVNDISLEQLVMVGN